MIQGEDEMSEWQPIETAPKDGTEVLVWSEHGGVESAYWEAGCYGHSGWTIYQIRTEIAEPDFPPTHWMPLPEPPK